MFNSYQIEQQIQQALTAHQFIGLALAVVQGTEVTYARGFGTTSIEDGGLPVTPKTLFCIGSISKTLTATLVLRLAEQGKLDLDIPVITYLPGFSFSDPVLGRDVTLRHVLSHTTGLPSGGKDFGPRDPDALRRFVYEDLARYRFIAPPGRLHLYSNTVIVLAGHVAEVVTGKYYDALVQEYIFAPLQMQRSTFDRTVAMTYPLALAHEHGEDGVLHTKHRFTDNLSGNPAGFGLSSTLDLANFAIMQLNHGQFQGQTLLSPEALQQMQTPHGKRYTSDWETGYGLALYTGSYKGVRKVGHGGMLESYNCYVTLFPDNGVAVVLQTNYDGAGASVDLIESIYDQLLDLPASYPRPAPVAPAMAQWPRYVGTYLSAGLGLAQVAIVDQQLTLERYGQTLVLTAIEGGLYQADGTTVGFVGEAPDGIDYLVIDSEPYRRFVEEAPFTPDPALWSGYAGVYQQWDIDPYPVHIQVEDRQLLVTWGGDQAVATPLSNTRFVSAVGLLAFELAADGQTPVLITADSSRHYRVVEGR